MTKKTLKRQRKQRGGNAEDPEDVKKGLDDLVTYFLYEIEIKNLRDGDGQLREFLKHGEKERKALVYAYYEYGSDEHSTVHFDENIMIAIALLRYYMFDDQVIGPQNPKYSVKKYGVFDIKDLKNRKTSRPGINCTEELRKAAKKFSLIQPSTSNLGYTTTFESMNLTSRIYKALDPEKQRDFISKLFDKLKQYANEIKGEVKVFDGKTTIDIARGHLLDKPESEPEKKEELTLLERLNTFENALWFIILYIFSVVKFSYKNTDRGFFLRGRIKLREEDTDEFRQGIIEEAEKLLGETDKGVEMTKIHDEDKIQAFDKIEVVVRPTRINKGGTRKRQKRAKK